MKVEKLIRNFVRRPEKNWDGVAASILEGWRKCLPPPAPACKPSCSTPKAERGRYTVYRASILLKSPRPRRLHAKQRPSPFFNIKQDIPGRVPEWLQKIDPSLVTW